MVSWLNKVRLKRRERLLAKKMAFNSDADAQKSSSTMKNRTPTHQQMRSTGGG